MSRIRRGAGGKRDAAEKGIREALDACGATIWMLSGQGCPDLLVLYRGRYVPLEVKTGSGTRTKNQQTIPWPIVRTPDEAIAAIREAAPWPPR